MTIFISWITLVFVWYCSRIYFKTKQLAMPIEHESVTSFKEDIEFFLYVRVCNEHAYFESWAEYYRNIGFTTMFLIVDDEREEEYRKMLHYSWKIHIFTTDDSIKDPTDLLTSYYLRLKDALKNASKNSWVFNVDLDEYLILPKAKTIQNYVKKLPYDVNSVILRWVTNENFHQNRQISN